MEKLLVLIFAVLSLLFQPAAAAPYRFGVGDAIAIIVLAIVIYLIVGVIGLCALLGWIARKRARR